MTTLRSLTTYQGIPVWRHVLIIQWATQIVSGILVVVAVVWFFANIANAVQDREIPHGFSFLDREYQTPIGHTFPPYESSDTFLYAFFVGTTNTVIVSVIGVILATALGVMIGVARMSSNWIVSKAALTYIEFFRNIPLLVQLFFWFYIVLALPQVRQGLVIADRFYINNAGLSLPFPVPGSLGAALSWTAFVVVAIIAGVVVNRLLTRRETLTGSASYPLLAGWGTAIVISAVGWLIVIAASAGAPFVISVPAPQGTFGRIAGGSPCQAAWWRCWLDWLPTRRLSSPRSFEPAYSPWDADRSKQHARSDFRPWRRCAT